jgi:Histidine kinase-, DNA gyrase B-, and HSP90-like ATPase
MSEHDKIILGQTGDQDADPESRKRRIANLRKSQQEGVQSQSAVSSALFLNIAIFDDDQKILDLYVSAKEQINHENGTCLDLHPVQPTEPCAVAKTLYDLHGKLPPVDLVLIDNSFDSHANMGTHFYAKDVLLELSKFQPEEAGTYQGTKHRLRPRYLPRIVVTQSAYSPGIMEQLGIAGADKVIFFKGGDTAADKEGGSNVKQLLQKLLQPAEWDDIRRRACHRLWRQLLIDIETEIQQQKTPTDTTEKAKEIMAGLMNFVKTWLLDAGVADNVYFRIAERDLKNPTHPLMLRDANTTSDGRLETIQWNKLPTLQRLAEQDLSNETPVHIGTRKLSKAELPKELSYVAEEPGYHSIGVPLNCRHGFFGTLTMIRKRTTTWDNRNDPQKDDDDHKDDDPCCFTSLEAENLVRVAQRLSFYYEQLLDATLLLRRQRGLLTLAEELAGHIPYEKMIHSAVQFLHKEFHLNYELAYKKKYYNNAPGNIGRVTCFLLEPASGLIYSPTGTGEGFEAELETITYSTSPKKHTTENNNDSILTLASHQSLYALVISEGKTLYRLKPDDNLPYRQSTSIPMRTAMMEPLRLQGKILGSLNIEHAQDGFYGPLPNRPETGPTGNDNLDVLKAVARVLAQTLHARRQLKFEEELIHLATSTGPADEAQVMDNIAQAVYAYAGPGVLIWREPDANNQLQIMAAWKWRDPEEAKAILNNDGPMLVRMSPTELAKWNTHNLEVPHFECTFREFLAGGESDNYSEEATAISTANDKTLRGFPTAAQYSLVLVNNNNGKSKKAGALGVLALLFRSKNALGDDQKVLLRKFGSFVGTYLSSVRRDKQFLGVDKKRELAEFLLALSHQARHSLKSKLNGIADKLEYACDIQKIPVINDPQSLIKELRQLRADLSATHLMPHDLSLSIVNPSECWRKVRDRLSAKVNALDVKIPLLASAATCLSNKDIIENAFLILVDNALDEFKRNETRPSEGWHIWCETKVIGNSAIFDVCDNGTGFTKEVRDHFGKLGITTKASSGTGIYWCKRFLPLVNGQIELLPHKPGRGAKIRLILERG